MKDIMIDLETMGISADAAVVTIGAVEFDPQTGKLGQEFYRVIELQSCIDVGLRIDAVTVYWWLQQSKMARAEIVDTVRHPLHLALKSFTKFCESVSDRELDSQGQLSDIRLWGNDPSFDIAKMQFYYDACCLVYPGKFWNTRCVRTILGFLPPRMWEVWKEENQRVGYHNALSDCIHQVKYTSYIFKELGNPEIY